MRRQKAREMALQLLYQCDNKVNPYAIEQALDTMYHKYTENFLDETLSIDVEYARSLFFGVKKFETEIDEILQKNSENWKISRMTAVDRNILRISIFEMKYLEDVPEAVSINEAIELGKKFGDLDSPKFINGILDAVKKLIH